MGNENDELIALLQEHSLDMVKTGSRHTVTPPVLDTDEDVVFLVEDYEPWNEILAQQGFSFTRSTYSDDIRSMSRKGTLNVITTTCREEFCRWELSTEVAKALNLKDKQDRAALYETIRRSHVWKNLVSI